LSSVLSKQEWYRLIGFAARCSGSAVLAYAVARALGLSFPVWALVSAIVVSQEQLAETWASTGRRVAGTVLGAAVAVAVNAALSPLAAGVSVQVALAVAICAAITHRYPVMRVSMWTCAIVLLTARPPDPLYLTGFYRGSEVILGGLIGATLHQLTEKLLDFLDRIETKQSDPGQLESVAKE
jgi:uncharacterized membrane protein YgaE (UPF0421/DUF939 family)